MRFHQVKTSTYANITALMLHRQEIQTPRSSISVKRYNYRKESKALGSVYLRKMTSVHGADLERETGLLLLCAYCPWATEPCSLLITGDYSPTLELGCVDPCSYQRAAANRQCGDHTHTLSVTCSCDGILTEKQMNSRESVDGKKMKGLC